MTIKENYTWVIEKKGENKMEALETMALAEDKTTKMTRIGTTLSPGMRTRLIQFLKENPDVFTWSHEDMPGISPEIILHRLNANPERKPVQQKWKAFAPKRD